MVKKITSQSLDQLQAQAVTAGRLRAHMNIHESLDAAVQRLFVATEPQTYMRPHRHPQEHKWEFFLVLEGSIDLLLFDDAYIATPEEDFAVWAPGEGSPAAPDYLKWMRTALAGSRYATPI